MAVNILKQTTGTSGSRYALVDTDGALTIQMPTGEAGKWFVVQDDGYDLAGDFETHVDNLDEETRTLAAEARAEFAHDSDENLGEQGYTVFIGVAVPGGKWHRAAGNHSECGGRHLSGGVIERVPADMAQATLCRRCFAVEASGMWIIEMENVHTSRTSSRHHFGTSDSAHKFAAQFEGYDGVQTTSILRMT